MGTKLVNTCVKEENMDFPSIPPGFESLAPFTLKKVEATETKARYSAFTNASESGIVKMETDFGSSDDAKKSLRRRPGTSYSQFDNSSEGESDSEQHLPLRPRLPKGVIRGCEECSNCQKVTAKWRPVEACRPNLQDAPVFYPTEEEFEDTLKYIASIRSKAEAYGICRIVPPPSWKPPCPLKEEKIWESSKFSTRIQRIDKLQNRDSMMKMLKINHNNKRRKRRRCMKNGAEHVINGNGEIRVLGEAVNYEALFGFEPGLDLTLDAFQKYADDFKAQYFRKNDYTLETGVNTQLSQARWEPSVEDIEGEYWRMVEKPTEEIEVLYGADLETGVFGSGFPKYTHQIGAASEMKYVNSGWNLNNFPRLSGSVLSYESSDISGVLVPWLYIGMCFSSFCWHVEDHHLYSLNYMHWGAPKMWYGVPGADALKLEAAMRKHLPDLFEEQPDLLHKLVTQLSPSILKAEGVPVYRCVQNPGEFVLTFPRAYHAGFNCGFNCAEAVNVAPVDWLPHGQNAIELYRDQGRRTSISHDKLLLGAARDAVRAHWELNLLRKNTTNNLRWLDVCGKDGILSKALKTRVEMERVRREFLCKSSQALKMESTFDATSERECSVCLFDLHLSAAGCHNCSPDKYACLNHAKQLCSCSWGAKFFLFRYDINELNILVEALEGKLSAVYRWAKQDLGLALSSYISKENKLASGLSGKLSSTPGLAAKNMSSRLGIASVKEQKEKDDAANPSGELLALEKTNVLSMSQKLPQEGEAAKAGLDCRKEILQSVSNLETLPSQPALEKLTGNIASEKPEVKKPPSSGNGDVILLSDDEGEEPCRPPPAKPKDPLEKHVAHSDDTGSSGSCVNNPIATTSTNDMAVIAERSNCSSNSGCTKVEAHSNGVTHLDHSTGETHSRPNAQQRSCCGLSSFNINLDLSFQNHSSTKEAIDWNMENAGMYLQNSQPSDGGKSNNEDSQKKLDSDASSRSMNNVQTISNNPCGSQNNLDRYYRQKGPRIAKVVRRINCNVEPLEFGVVQPGEFWSDSRAIYPKGFRSRVKYINAVNPTEMCYYVSEILDAGRRPLFMVSLEHFPSEVFVHTSTTRCWEMVRERVNQEITKQHKLGTMKLPPLQPPGSLDGMEMFGFSSPAIVQVIQAMDKNRVCTEYWKSRPLMQIPQHSQSADNPRSLFIKSEVSNDNEGLPLPAGIDTTLNGLFKKANPEELHALYSSLSNASSVPDQGLVTRLLKEEIHKRSR